MITRFCDAEFNGVRDVRIKLAVYGQDRENELRAIDPQLGGRVTFWDADPIGVVSTFTIVNVSSDNSIGTALVEYSLILNTVGDGVINRVFKKSCNDRHTVIYSLIKRDGNWSVYNPPLPYISLKALMEYYSSEISPMPKDILTEKNTPRRSAFDQLNRNLDFLNKVSLDPGYCQ